MGEALGFKPRFNSPDFFANFTALSLPDLSAATEAATNISSDVNFRSLDANGGWMHNCLPTVHPDLRCPYSSSGTKLRIPTK